ncbi:MAG: ABC transporter ATP-binding protein [Deltaproteobacteria bacterium]|nr:MAG: ABC transporter ATP-binding protein [Deltaproteobacteria bacterium]
MTLQIQNISYAYTENASVLQDVSCTFETGELLGILGPNGAGKTTLLKILAGFLSPQSGSVDYQSKNISHLSIKERSRLIAYVAQSEEIFLPYTVRQIILMGRAPYLGLMGFESAKDQEIVTEAMELTDVKKFENRLIQDLSGGEQQRVFLARALAQQTPILLLDEPTSHLDLHHQIHFFKLLNTLRKKGLTIITTLHDLNLASLFADRCLILKNGQAVALGSPGSIFTSQLLSDVYECSLKVEHSPTPYVRPLL